MEQAIIHSCTWGHPHAATMILPVCNHHIPDHDTLIKAIIHCKMYSFFVVNQNGNQGGPDKRNKTTENFGAPVNPFIDFTAQAKAGNVVKISRG